MRSTPKRVLSLTAAAAAAAVAVPAGAQAATARVDDGQTMLRLNAGTARALAANGVRVGPVAPARTGSSGLTFPITGGAINPANLRGAVSHGGGLRFRAGGRTVVLRNPQYTIRAGRAALSARVGSARLTILTLNLSRAKVGRDGPLTKTASGIRATLTARAATALNRAFSTRLFRRGLAIGTVRTEINLRDAVLGGGATTLAPDPLAGAALSALGITLGTVGGATTGPGGIGFPINGGKVDATSLAGAITHAGSGISLTRGTTVVNLTDFVVGIDETPALSALVGSNRVEILSLDVSQIRRSVDGETIVVENVVASLTPAAAIALNQLFATTAFAPGLKLGTATVRAQTV